MWQLLHQKLHKLTTVRKRLHGVCKFWETCKHNECQTFLFVGSEEACVLKESEPAAGSSASVTAHLGFANPPMPETINAKPSTEKPIGFLAWC